MATLSRFLPDSFQSEDQIVLMAGRGSYPELTARRIKAAGLPLKLIGLKGETSDSLFDSFESSDRKMIKVGQIGKLTKTLKEFGSRYVVMVGQVQPNRLFGGIHPDLRAIKILASLKEKNAATIFGAIVREIEGTGCTVLDARAFIDDDLATEGSMTGGKPSYSPVSLENRPASILARASLCAKALYSLWRRLREPTPCFAEVANSRPIKKSSSNSPTPITTSVSTFPFLVFVLLIQ